MKRNEQYNTAVTKEMTFNPAQKAGHMYPVGFFLNVLPDKNHRYCEVLCAPSCHDEWHSYAWLALAL